MAQLGLGDDIRFIVDDHPQKVQKYTPGHRIPVLPTAELCRRMPEYTIILAWIHAKKIIAANKKYLQQGGHFIVCCPEVRVIGVEDADESSSWGGRDSDHHEERDGARNSQARAEAR